MKKILVSTLLLGLLSIQNAFADTNKSIIHLKNGSTITGNIIEKNMSYIKVKILNSTDIVLNVSDIEKIDDLEKTVNEYVDNYLLEINLIAGDVAPSVKHIVDEFIRSKIK